MQSWAQPGTLTGEARSLLSLTMCEQLAPHTLSYPHFEEACCPQWIVIPSSCPSLICPSWAGSIAPAQAMAEPWDFLWFPRCLQVGCNRGLNMGPVVASSQSYCGTGTDGAQASFLPHDPFASHTAYDALRIILWLHQRASAPWYIHRSMMWIQRFLTSEMQEALCYRTGQI